MGSALARSQPQADPGQQQAFIDSEGNLRQPARGAQWARDVELRNVQRDEQTRGFAQLGSQEQGQQWWHLRACFPSFRWGSALGVIVALQLVVYAASCWLITPREIAQPNSVALWKIGSSNSRAERCASAVGGKYLVELRRLVVPVFLHGGVLHILMNLYFEFVSGQRALEKYGARPFLLLFFVSGVCGNLLSDAFEVNGVGASTSCYGLLGADFAQVGLVWYLPSTSAEWRNQMQGWLVQMAGMLIFWEVVNWKTIDHFGHLGGLLSGLALGVALARDGELPANISQLRRRCAAGLALGMGLCAYKIFFWGSRTELELNGRPYPWRLVCEAMWTNYFKA